MPTIGYPSGTNTYVPNSAASQNLVVGYSREASTFKLPQYAQYVMAKNNQGLYFVWASRQGARILNNNDADHNWADGDAAPTGLNNLEGGDWYPFLTQRKCYAFTMGQMAVEQASFPLLAAQGGVAAQMAMTARTMLSINALVNASWGSRHTAAVDNGILASGQNWTTGSVGYSNNPGPNIKLSLQYAATRIMQDTLGTVNYNMLSLIVNPTTAMAMASSTEVQDYLKQSDYARDQIMGTNARQNGQWGLPDQLYGVKIVVEDAVRVTSAKGTTDAISYIMPDNAAFLVARQGELAGIEGTRSFSTLQIFFYKDELTVETKFDQDNRRYLGRVISNFVPIMVSNYSGFYFTDVLGT